MPILLPPVVVTQVARPFIQHFEGCRLKAYTDQRGRVTIGYGHTGDIKLGDIITQEECDSILEKDMLSILATITPWVYAPISVNQAAALLSFSFNLGPFNLKKSGLLRFLNQQNYQAAADQFLLWNHEGLYVDPGLTKRRQAERALFLQKDTDEAIIPPPPPKNSP